jgi:hypothetical protein
LASIVSPRHVVRPFCLNIDVERSDGEASMKVSDVPNAAIGLLPGEPFSPRAPLDVLHSD